MSNTARVFPIHSTLVFKPAPQNFSGTFPDNCVFCQRLTLGAVLLRVPSVQQEIQQVISETRSQSMAAMWELNVSLPLPSHHSRGIWVSSVLGLMMFSVIGWHISLSAYPLVTAVKLVPTPENTHFTFMGESPGKEPKIFHSCEPVFSKGICGNTKFWNTLSKPRWQLNTFPSGGWRGLCVLCVTFLEHFFPHAGRACTQISSLQSLEFLSPPLQCRLFVRKA